jgi:DUF4097 and DUF4098 domain-containing protein YvlB
MKANYPSTVLTAALMASALTLLGGELREEFHQTYELKGDGEVSVENVTGSVRIRAWDRDEVKVDAVKSARRQDHLDKVEIDVQSKPGKVQIRTKYLGRGSKDSAASVDYTLRVPRDSKVRKINLVNGPVEIEGVRGEVVVNSVNGPVSVTGVLGKTTLSTVNGPVKAAFKELHEPASLASVNGTVTIALAAGVDANLSATTLHGGISSDFPITVERSSPLGQKLEGELGAGGPQIKLSTVNGGIHVDRTKRASTEDGDS